MAKGIRQSLIKLPHTETEIETLLHTIERDIQKLRGTEVTSAQIGDFVMKRLKEMNKVAYIRFACVYRAFEDVAAFQKELKKL
jgi:transcriptional repressor NrdR